MSDQIFIPETSDALSGLTLTVNKKSVVALVISVEAMQAAIKSGKPIVCLIGHKRPGRMTIQAPRESVSIERSDDRKSKAK